MTLYNLLRAQCVKYANAAQDELLGMDKEFYKNFGRMDMCELLIDLLSDETLNMKVETRNEVLNKPKKKTDDKIYKYTYPF